MILIVARPTLLFERVLDIRLCSILLKWKCTSLLNTLQKRERPPLFFSFLHTSRNIASSRGNLKRFGSSFSKRESFSLENRRVSHSDVCQNVTL